MTIQRHLRAHGRAVTALLAAALATATLTAAAPPAAATPAAASKPATTAAAGGLLSVQQATARAKSTGKPVEVTSLTSQTSLTQANPNGTMTLTQSALPTRVRQHGKWANLDATLKANPDGTLSPTAALNQVILSGGGTSPLASLYTGGQGISLTLPVTLPRPTLSGPSAVYADVLPGVDLTVTVQTDGAVSDVFTVRTPAAARNPQLASLLTTRTTTTRGLKVQSDTTGDLAVTDTAGHPLYTAPTPQAWDSSTPAAATEFTSTSGALTAQQQSTVVPRGNAATQPPSSTFHAPGRSAHIAKLKVHAGSGAIVLGAPSALLTGADTTWPVYLDPTLSPEYGNTGWSSPGAGVAGDSYWKKSVSYSGDTEVGNSGDVQGEAMSIFDFPIDLATLRGGTIYAATFGIKEDYSWACPTSGHNQTVNIYAPSQVLTSANATWNAWVNNLGSSVDSHSFALGYNSSCPANSTPPFNVKTQINNDINGTTPKATQTLVLRAADHSDNYALKQFDPKTAQLTVTYDQTPKTPTGLYTSPTTKCTGGSTLGDTSVTLYAPVSTATKFALTTTFHLYKTGDTAKTNLLTTANGIASDTYSGASGQTAVLAVSEAFYKARAAGAATSFSWIAQTTDGTLTSAWSAACSFTWDPTRPGAPVIVPDPAPPVGAVTCPTLDVPAGTVQSIGSTCSFTFQPPTDGSTGLPAAVSGYLYQLNQDPPQTVPATANATVSVRLPRLVNTLTVSALSAGGNLGSPVTAWFDGAALNPAATDGDVTGDGYPDLIVPGNASTALPAGLWLEGGGANGNIAPNGTNIGANGLGFSTNASPADWNGAQAVTGDFCGYGEQDVLAYFPTGNNAGGGSVVCNDGSSGSMRLGDPTQAGADSAPYMISAGSFQDDAGNTATQIAAAGNTSGKGTGIPDILATVNNQLVLFYAQTPNGYTGNAGFDPICVDGGCSALTALNTPDGSQDWNSWTITTAQLASGTAMYLWKPSTGALDLWTGLSLSAATGTTLTTTGQYTLASSGWNTGDNRVLRAADFSGSGVPDLWATDPSTGSTTAYLPAALADNPVISTTAPTVPSTATHAWQLNDYGTASPTTAADDTSGTTLNLTGTSGVSSNTGDAFSPDIALTASDHDTLATTGKAIDLTKDFTVSAWADPTSYGGTVLSQDGSADSGLRLLATASGWQFSLNTGAGTAWAFDDVVGGSVQLGAWSHLTATYNHTTKTMALYVDDVLVATGTHTAPPPARVEASASARTRRPACRTTSPAAWPRSRPGRWRRCRRPSPTPRPATTSPSPPPGCSTPVPPPVPV
ncbi:LamG-like jellyroll fold domain-containing protein [Streptacidiphilus sp. N1-3]|uniref:LamG-like jellyroll fold domain-containing protein n=1 Tax=Streptacidiphilus alkalitolerans TaxID=3342712 RepID=A0ABV6WXE5_9ACTN